MARAAHRPQLCGAQGACPCERRAVSRRWRRDAGRPATALGMNEVNAKTVGLVLLAAAAVSVPIANELPDLVELFLSGETRDLDVDHSPSANGRRHPQVLFIAL